MRRVDDVHEIVQRDYTVVINIESRLIRTIEADGIPSGRLPNGHR